MATTPELSRKRRIGVLLICCMSLFIVGLDITVVNVALPSIGSDLGTRASPGCSGRSTPTRWCMASLLMFSGSIGRPASAAGARFVTRPRRVLGRLAAVQPRAERRAARRLPRAAGGRRLDAEPGRDVDHHQHVHRPARARAGGRRLGRGVRHLDGARADRRRHARLLGRLAVDLLINIPVGLAAIVADAALHPRVAGAAAAPVRSRRPGAGDRPARRR